MTGRPKQIGDEVHAPPDSIPRGPRRRSNCSKAGYYFQLQHFTVFDFFWFAISLATAADRARFTASKALATMRDEKSLANFESVRKNPEPAFRKMRSFSEYHSEIMIIRLVDNFMCFLSEALQACMWKRPELLKSKDQVKIEDVLRFSKRSDLIDFLINRKLNELSYGGLRGIEDFLDERLGVSLAKGAVERAELSISIELRNIYTHNRGIVNELFIGRLMPHEHDFHFVEGQRFHADFDTIVRLANNLFDTAIHIDTEVVSKFHLLKKRYATWDAPRVALLDRDAERRKHSEGS